MKSSILFVLLALALLVTPHTASAFSTEQPIGENSDGSSKFADPDEQMPAMVSSPDSHSGINGVMSFGEPGLTLPSPVDNDSGAQAFDRAFAHQQDKE